MMCVGLIQSVGSLKRQRFPKEEGHLSRGRTEVQLRPSLHFIRCARGSQGQKRTATVSGGKATSGAGRWKTQWYARRGLWGHCTEGEVSE